MHGPQEKKERALGVRLGLKADRAASPKSSMTRKPYRPGVHGPKSRPKALSEFGLQLREKSKFKIMYGIDENALKRVFTAAVQTKGATGAKMIEILETRLDSVIYHLGFAPNRASARQLVVHGHIMVNKRKVQSPAYQMEKGDIVSIRPGSETKTAIKTQKEALKKYEAPSWLRVDAEKMEGEVLSAPTDVQPPFEINLLVDAFSK